MVKEAHEPEPPRTWNPKAAKPFNFYSDSLNMNFPVSRLDWSDWHEALRAASPHLDNEQLLAALLWDASMETCYPEDPLFDMPWYERENFIAEAVITAGWVPPERQATDHPPHQCAVEDETTTPYDATDQRDPDGWGSWYANLSRKNPQLDDFYLLGELIHAIFVANHGRGTSEAEQTRYLASAIISAGWTAPP